MFSVVAPTLGQGAPLSTLVRRTKDHSYVQALVDQGVVARQEMEASRARSLAAQAQAAAAQAQAAKEQLAPQSRRIVLEVQDQTVIVPVADYYQACAPLTEQSIKAMGVLVDGLDAGTPDRRALDLLDRRQLRVRLSLLPAWALSHNVSLYLLRHTGGSRIIHLEKERNKNK